MEAILALAKAIWAVVVIIAQNPLLLALAIFSFIGVKLDKHR